MKQSNVSSLSDSINRTNIHPLYSFRSCQFSLRFEDEEEERQLTTDGFDGFSWTFICSLSGSFSIFRFLVRTILNPMSFLIANSTRVMISVFPQPVFNSALENIEREENSRRRTTFPFLPIIPPVLTPLLSGKDIIRYTHLIYIVFIRCCRSFQPSRSVRTVESLSRLNQVRESSGMVGGFSGVGRNGGRLFRGDRECVEPLRVVLKDKDQPGAVPPEFTRERILTLSFSLLPISPKLKARQ